MKLEKAKERCKELIGHNYLEDLGYLREENEHIKFNTAIKTLLQEIEHLQKENEELKNEIEQLNEYTDYKTEIYQEMLEDKQNYIDLLKEE